MDNCGHDVICEFGNKYQKNMFGTMACNVSNGRELSLLVIDTVIRLYVRK